MAPRIPSTNTRQISNAMLDALNAQFNQTAHELGIPPERAARVRPNEASVARAVEQAVRPAPERLPRRPRGGPRMREAEGYSAMERRSLELLAAQAHQNMVVMGLENALRAAREELGKINGQVQELKTKLRNRP